MSRSGFVLIEDHFDILLNNTWSHSDTYRSIYNSQIKTKIIMEIKIAVFLSCGFPRSGTETKCVNVAYINIDLIAISQY